MEDKQAKKLTKAQEVFIDEYLLCLNATDAYLKAYPKVSRETAATNGSRLLRNAQIREEIERRFAERHMSANEALALQANIARGDITEFITPLGQIDVELLKESGNGRLVKKIKQRTITKIGKGAKDDDTEIHETEIELYPADVAQERILRIAGKIAPTEVNIKVNLTDD